MENSNESYDSSVTKTTAELIEEAQRIEKPGLSDSNEERIHHLELAVAKDFMRIETLERQISNVMKLLSQHESGGPSDQTSDRSKQIERDAKLLVAVLVADFKEGKTTGIPIEAGVLTESLGFKRPTDVYLDVQKKGL